MSSACADFRVVLVRRFLRWLAVALGPLGGIGALLRVVLERMRVVFADRWLEGSVGLFCGVLLVDTLGRFVRLDAAESPVLQVRPSSLGNLLLGLWGHFSLIE